MGKLFGTDGVRGIVGLELNVDLALKIGASTARVLKKDKGGAIRFFFFKQTINF